MFIGVKEVLSTGSSSVLVGLNILIEVMRHSLLKTCIHSVDYVFWVFGGFGGGGGLQCRL